MQVARYCPHSRDHVYVVSLGPLHLWRLLMSRLKLLQTRNPLLQYILPGYYGLVSGAPPCRRRFPRLTSSIGRWPYVALLLISSILLTCPKGRNYSYRESYTYASVITCILTRVRQVRKHRSMPKVSLKSDTKSR